MATLSSRLRLVLATLLVAVFALGASTPALANETTTTDEQPSLAYSSDDDGTFTTEDGSVLRWKKNGTDAVKITGYDSLTANLVIPSEIEGLPVMAIANIGVGGTPTPNSTFYGATELVTVTIPSSVHILSGMDFANCTNLTEVKIEGPINYMGTSEFAFCTALKSIEIAGNLTEIQSATFEGCTSLTKVVLPDSVKTIATGAFGECTSLTEINFPRSLTSIGTGAFNGTALERVDLPSGVTTIATNAFKDCAALKVAYLPKTVTSIGDGAFDNGIICLTDVDAKAVRTWASNKSITYIAGQLTEYTKASYDKNWDFTGSPIEPDVTLKNANYDVFPAKYLNIAYSNNTNAGTANITVTSELFLGQTLTDEFTIKQIYLWNDKVAFPEIPKQYYSGAPLTPEVTITFGDYTLVEGFDYDIRYENNNKNYGSGRVVINGKGNFRSTETLYFDIDGAPVVISFETNGGSKVAPYTGEYGTSYGIWQYIDANEPTRAGYTFDGWFLDKALTLPYNYRTYEPTGDMTVYAKWKAGDPSEANTVTMYRLYNPYSGEHLYTLSTSEYNSLGSIGWRKEGIAWKSPKTSTTPVYRLYNQYSGDHHYTTSYAEYVICKGNGWTGEGIGFYSDDAKGIPVYRLFNPYVTVGTHHYTTDAKEYKWLGIIGWKQENIAWYGVK